MRQPIRLRHVKPFRLKQDNNLPSAIYNLVQALGEAIRTPPIVETPEYLARRRAARGWR